MTGKVLCASNSNSTFRAESFDKTEHATRFFFAIDTIVSKSDIGVPMDATLSNS